MIAKIITLLLLSSVKFIFAFPLAYKYDFNFITTLLITSIGGIAGIIFFSFFWEHVINIYLWFVHSYLYRFPKIRTSLQNFKRFFIPQKKQNSTPFKRKRRYVWIKQNGGLLGISLLTPFILSIPIGTFLAVRFFGRNFRTLTFLCLTLLFWAFILSILVHWVGIRY
ncbi:MAG: hypothetical protein N2449_02555 [Bacteroidales bacterium]|nr:hypothetical protein [Bacteroidales bacterium]